MPKRKRKLKSKSRNAMSIKITVVIVLMFFLSVILVFENNTFIKSFNKFTQENPRVLENWYFNNARTDENVIFNGPRYKKQITLTFDADMTEYMKEKVLSGYVNKSYDERIFETLIKTNTKADFFLTGMWIEMYPTLTKTLSENPLFEIGNHSYSHRAFNGNCYGLPKLNGKMDAINDINQTDKLLKKYTGANNIFFRFPGGCYSKEDIQIVRNSGDLVIQWDVKGEDGFNQDAQLIVENVVRNVKNGSIIVLHLNGSPTAPKTYEALPVIIDTLKKRGFTFVKLSELLGISLSNNN